MKEEDLSDEDLALKRQPELALESMRQEIRTATSSMTSVPKPLKFLRPQYVTIKSFYETMPELDLKKYLADILSVLALTMSEEGERESLKIRLLGPDGDIGSWGHEYMRLSHDTDSEVAMSAIIALGLIGAGTNNACIAGMLRNLSIYYYKEATLLFCVRIAQGLIHLGKGHHSDRFLLSRTALAGFTIMLHACLDMKSIILGKYHYVLYFLVLAMQPRMLMTVEENLKPLTVPVWVSQAVDVVGQAGQPKTITGFQTHSTPVLLAAGDQAELATEKYILLSPVLEGFAILRENPEYKDEK